MVALNLNRQESINSDSAGSHKKNKDIGRNKRISLETKFIFLALLVAGLFLVVTNSSIVTYANMNIAKMSSHEKLKRDFLRSTDKTPKVIGVDSANNENEDIPVARQEYEKLKRDFLDSTGKQEEDLTMTIITKSSDADTFCACAIVSVDCLDSVNCIPTQAASLRDVARGILLRSLIKQTATFEGSADIRNSRVPMGKGFQYKTITAWYSWAKYNKLPSEHDPYPSYIFLQNAKKKHQMCADNNLFGFQCYFTAINEKEEFDSLEAEALRYHHHLLKTELDLEQHMLHQLRDIQAAVSEDKGNEIHALDHLRIFANILRMLFNRNEPLRELSSQTRVFNANERGQSQKESDATPLKVSIHIRRADACMAEGKLVPESSPLDSCAQQFAQRICYATSVYMDALRRLRDIMSKRDPTRRIEVFISSDDASNMMDEIEGQFPDLYLSMTWHILDFDRERFNYKGFVEGYDHKNHNLLGEAAAADLWLLSNGEVFIGHLGSRFGKVAYLLATARHNRFVPFFSVDGHSVCCEIDEPCGEMKPYIKSMSDCLTFSHDQVSDDYGYEINEDYFDVGSYMRKIIAQAQSLSGDESYKVEVASGVGHGSGGDGEKQIQTTPTPTTDKTEEKTDQWPWADLTAPVADYEYFPETRRRQSVDEPVFLLDKHCSSLVLDTSPPIVRPPSNGSCDGFDGVLHIRQGDVGGAAGTIFFVFLLGQLQYAEQFNLKPWVHLNSESEKVYDPLVHDQGEQRKFTMMDGMDISWARDAQDPDGYLFPGRPRHKRPGRLRQKEFSVEGTGVWNHYFLPVSDFSPGDPSCENKPILTFDHDMIAPGIHYQSPWAPMVWRVGDIAHINRNDLDFDVWIEPKRRNAAKLVKNYIRFNAEIQQRAECAHPKQENSLGIHIRHSDKEVTRGGAIALSNFFPYAQAFVEHGGGSIFVATDSSLVIDEIRSKWPSDITSHVVYQVGTILSHNDTATFELGISHHRINVEALTDILALSKCTYLVHGLSALSEAAIYLNPSLIERSINLEQYDQDDKAKYANFLKMISE